MADVQKVMQAVVKAVVAQEEAERKRLGVLCETLPGGLVTRPRWTVTESLPVMLTRTYRLPRASGESEARFRVEVRDDGLCVVKEGLVAMYEGGHGPTHLYVLGDFFTALGVVAEATKAAAQAINRKEG